MTTEAEKFDKFGAEWWDPKGKLFSLHMINPLRFDYFAEKAGDLKGKLVIDIGCGGGLLAEKFASAGAIVTGIDLSPVAIDTAKKHAAETGVEVDYIISSPSGISKENIEKFDIVICAEVLEHVDDLRGFLADTLAMLKHGGLFFFGTINKTLKARLLALFVAEDILKLLPKGTHDYSRFIRPSELVRVLAENGVEAEEIKGLSYDPLRLEFRITGDTSVNYLGWAKKLLD
ncbi:bifunctional 2-polyprenyl-6-hydroxyphenol methylase/3-demethylubiquinol 3-O-methyltransferase UbiG [bacterium]|nr:MAG: bifunctional 2-polyprenyl-6-hydroxyphenol methylase/3-demethylubiquinol 3-O-methyltransferase UbiG [bacterium]